MTTNRWSTTHVLSSTTKFAFYFQPSHFFTGIPKFPTHSTADSYLNRRDRLRKQDLKSCCFIGITELGFWDVNLLHFRHEFKIRLRSNLFAEAEHGQQFELVFALDPRQN